MAEQQDKPLHELLSRDMVDIYVGQENTHWILHQKLLCYRSKFFRNIFQSKENKNSQYGLPDEEDEPFRLFVGWLYSGYTPTPKEEKDLTVLLDLYLMAEKWEIRDLTLEVLKSVRNWYKESDTYPALRRVQYIYANTDLESPMRQLLISSVARNLVTSNSGMPPQWDKALRKNGQLAVDIIKAIQDWRLEEEIVPDAREEPAEAEDLVDVEQETAKLDEEAEQEIDDDVRAEHLEETADDTDDTVVESPTNENKRPKPTQQKSGKGADDLKSKDNGLVKDFSKFSLKEMPNEMTNGDYGTLRA